MQARKGVMIHAMLLQSTSHIRCERRGEERRNNKLVRHPITDDAHLPTFTLSWFIIAPGSLQALVTSINCKNASLCMEGSSALLMMIVENQHDDDGLSVDVFDVLIASFFSIVASNRRPMKIFVKEKCILLLVTPIL